MHVGVDGTYAHEMSPVITHRMHASAFACTCKPGRRQWQGCALNGMSYLPDVGKGGSGTRTTSGIEGRLYDGPVHGQDGLDDLDVPDHPPRRASVRLVILGVWEEAQGRAVAAGRWWASSGMMRVLGMY